MKIRANTAEWKWGNMQACPLYLYGNTCVLQFIKFNQMYTNPYTFMRMLRNIEEEIQFSQVVVSEHWVYLSFEENGAAKRMKRKRAELLCSVFVTRLNPWIVSNSQRRGFGFGFGSSSKQMSMKVQADTCQ